MATKLQISDWVKIKDGVGTGETAIVTQGPYNGTFYVVVLTKDRRALTKYEGDLELVATKVTGSEQITPAKSAASEPATVRCICGAAVDGFPQPGPWHSEWCLLYRKE